MHASMTRLHPLFVVRIIAVTMTTCNGTQRSLFPDSEIVYSRETYDAPEIGFIDSDGSGGQIVALRTSALAKPVWTDVGDSLYSIKWSGKGTYFGQLAIWRTDQRSPQTCPGNA